MNDLKTGARIGLGFAVVIMLTVILGAFAYIQLRNVRTAAESITSDALPGITLMGQLQSAVGMHNDMLNSYVYSNVIGGFLKSKIGAEEKSRLEASIRSAAKESESLLVDYEKTIFQAPDRVLFDKLKTARAPYEHCFQEVIDLSLAGKHMAALNLVTKKLDPFRKAYFTTIDEEIVFNKEDGVVASRNILTSVQSTSTSILVCLGLSIAIGIAIAFLITRSIAVPLTAAVVQLDEIANGDLSKDVPQALQKRGDELGNFATSMQRMIVALRKMMQGISGGIDVLSSSSTELSSSSQQMAGAAEETAAQANVVLAASDQVSKNVEMVATSTEELMSSIREISKSSNEAARIAGNATTAAEETNARIGKLGRSSLEIGQVIKVITSIAQQTNLLALNATIEAARAGDAGKGFSVVANEVKELAKQTAQATEDIGQRIGAIQADTKGAVESIAEITAIISQVNDISNTIAAAIEEQTATTAEIGRNAQEAARVTIEIAGNIAAVASAAKITADGAQNVQRTSHAVSEMAGQLEQLVLEK